MSATTYFKDRDGEPSGYEYQLVKKFADDNGLKLKLTVVDSIDDVFEAIAHDKAHVYVGGITKTEERDKKFQFSESNFEVQQQVVCRNRKRVKKVDDLVSLKLQVPSKSSYEESLVKLAKTVPNLKWDSIKDVNSEQLIEDLWEKEQGCILADSNIVQVHQRYFPELKVVYTFPQKEELAWIVQKDQEELLTRINSWFKKKEVLSFRKKLENQFYGHLQDFDVYDTKKFIERVSTRLPKYEKWLKQAAKKEGFDWKFLAAVAYQESQWNPKAKSPTGVRGFMMLTQNTAKSLGVTNRLDPKESIFGGAKYLTKMKKRFPSYIRGGDRKWLALASYNVGYYHLRDAQALALLKEFNPSQWRGVRKALPLLSNSRYFKKTWYGYARGQEPVIYVDRIKNYYDILKNVYGRVRRPASN